MARKPFMFGSLDRAGKVSVVSAVAMCLACVAVAIYAAVNIYASAGGCDTAEYLTDQTYNNQRWKKWVAPPGLSYGSAGSCGNQLFDGSSLPATCPNGCTCSQS